MQNHLDPSEGQTGQKGLPVTRLPIRTRLVLAAGVLVTGYALLLIGGGFPPQACKELFQALTTPEGGTLRIGALLIQSFAFVAAWGLLVPVTIQILRPSEPPRVGDDGKGIRGHDAGSSPSQGTGLPPGDQTFAVSLPTWLYATEKNPQQAENSQPPSQATPPFGSTLFPEFAQQDSTFANDSTPSALLDTTNAVELPSPTDEATAPPIGNEPRFPLRSEATGGKPSLLALFNGTSRDAAIPSSFQINWEDFSAPSETTSERGIDFAGWFLCHPGNDGENGMLEDTVLIASGMRTNLQPFTPFAFFILADGMVTSPTSTTGRVVSRALAEALFSVLWGTDPLDQEGVKNLLTNGVQYANNILFQQNQQSQASTIATLSVLLILGTTAYIANVGDNRVYFYRATDGLAQVTFDHSSVEEQFEQGKITPRELFKQPKENHVHRLLGMQASIPVDVFALRLKAQDLLLMCSDGVWKLIPQPVFDQLVGESISPPNTEPSLLCPSIVQQALAGGGFDPASVLVIQGQSVRQSESAARSPVEAEKVR